MNRGAPTIKRTHAKNYIPEEADKRLKEVTRPYQQQGLNALGVDSHPVFLYVKKMSTVACTCREVQTETESEIASAPAEITRSGISETNEITIDWRRPLFGEPHEARVEETDGTQLTDYEFDDSVVPHANQILESVPDCGICYRSGFVPGFEQYGKKREVVTTYNVVGYSAYTIDRATAPHTFQRLASTGWVEFELAVPKYFQSVQCSVRDNTEQVDSIPYLSTGILDLAYLKSNAGKTITFRISAESFTHVVFTFDLGTEPVLANIAQMSKVTDWTLFNTLGNLNVILPMTVPELTNGSIIVAPKFGLVLNVTDVQYLRVADGRNLDWSVNTRVCQPQETVRNIWRAIPIL